MSLVVFETQGKKKGGMKWRLWAIWHYPRNSVAAAKVSGRKYLHA